MQSKVNIIADDMGNVIRQSNKGSEYAFVRLQQERVTFGNNNWLKKSNISTLLQGKLEDLQSLQLDQMKSIPGKIVIREQLTPFNENDPDRDLKYAGDTGIICCQDGEPIYRKTFFVADVNAQDVLVAHTNGSDIKDANISMLDLIPKKKSATKSAIKPETMGFNSNDDEETDELVEVAEEETFEL